MNAVASHHFSIAVFDRRIELTDLEKTRTRKSILLSICLIVTSLVVLLLASEAAPLNLACGAAILSCSFVVLSNGAKRSFRIVSASDSPDGADQLGNLALAYAVFLILSVSVILMKVVQLILG